MAVWAWDGQGRFTIWEVSGRSNNTIQRSSRSSDHVISPISRQTHCGLSIWPWMCGRAPLMVVALVIAAFFRWKGLGSPICAAFRSLLNTFLSSRNGVALRVQSLSPSFSRDRKSEALRSRELANFVQASLQTPLYLHRIGYIVSFVILFKHKLMAIWLLLLLLYGFY